MRLIFQIIIFQNVIIIMIQKQLSRTLSQQSAAGSVSNLPSAPDSLIKLRLMEFYIASEEHSGLLTMREVQDWATDNLFDKNKVKQINQQLVNEGLLIERKKPTQFFQVAVLSQQGSKESATVNQTRSGAAAAASQSNTGENKSATNMNLNAKVEQMIALVRHAEIAKQKRLANRQEALRKEHAMREGCEAAQAELNNLEEERNRLIELRNQEMCSLQGVLDDLDHKVNVATNECAKWTDNTLQVVQHVLQEQQQTDQPLTFDQLLQQFPYLERVVTDSDCSQLGHIYAEQLAKIRAQSQ